jgi:hypothetical protein
MKQQTLMGLERYGKPTRRAQFLADMDRVVPWAQLEATDRTILPKDGRGRRPATDSAAADAACLLPAAVV